MIELALHLDGAKKVKKKIEVLLSRIIFFPSFFFVRFTFKVKVITEVVIKISNGMFIFRIFEALWIIDSEIVCFLAKALKIPLILKQSEKACMCV